ncbi:MAG: hypothetical protein ACPKPY_08275 [Nitrososphaeraceae archaeon]
MNGDMLECDLCHKSFTELVPLHLIKTNKILAVCRKCKAMNLWKSE